MLKTTILTNKVFSEQFIKLYFLDLLSFTFWCLSRKESNKKFGSEKKMSKNKCTCKKNEKGNHEEMSHSEKIEHLKECLGEVINRLECIKEMAEKISLD